jgi:hypothetical protein
MVPPGITAAFEMIEPQLALEIAILHFDRPALRAVRTKVFSGVVAGRLLK